MAGYLRAFDELELQRLRILQSLSGWPAEQLRFRIAPNTWSATEVLDHIVRCEAGTIDDLEAGMRTPQVLGEETRPGIAELRQALRSEGRFQVPGSAANIHPDAETLLPEVADRWAKARRHLQSLVQQVTPAVAIGGVFLHPSAGWMTFEEVLEYFSDHLYHHEFQLERVRTSWPAEGGLRDSGLAR